MAVDGLITVKSDTGPAQLLTRLDAAIAANDMTVFAHIDHAEAAATVGMSLRPTVVVIFGNPQGGTPLMQSAQTMGIDLPLRVLVWQDAAGDTWLSYNDVRWLGKRHGVGPDVEVNMQRIASVLERVAKAATAKP